MSRPEKIVSKQSLDNKSSAEDVGEAVRRRKETPTLDKRPELTIQRKITRESLRRSKSKCDVEANVKEPKKKNRKKNTIDELFNDFL